MVRSFLPAPIANLPFRMLLPLALLTCFGAAVLGSAAGGSFWAYSFSHLTRFLVFVAMGLVIRSFPRGLVALGGYPAYAAGGGIVVCGGGVGAGGGGGPR